MAPSPPAAPPPGMLGLPQFPPLTRLPSARAAAMRVLVTTPSLACFPYFALDTTTCMSTGPACSAYPDGTHRPFCSCSFSSLGLNPRYPLPSPFWVSLFSISHPNIHRVLSMFSLRSLSKVSFHSGPATTTLGKAALLPRGCSQGAQL